uniref:Aurora kinase A and ninein interacting protein n=1 Tax=Poecilia reticulata TaxID=8081 RepID=A0A3P9NMM5_POERE
MFFRSFSIMKNSKAAVQRSAQEECGIWLDTMQLKEKKRQARPISKLLNPLATGGGYSLAVALNFTQTKMEMPKTKQSSISAFFAPKRRGKQAVAVKNLSPQKQTDHSESCLAKESHFDSLWRNTRGSPLKKRQKCKEADEDSLATLFTQDSEGFRVIAHRGLQTRSPLKDQSNLSTGLVRSYKPIEEEEVDEDDEMLFTQDSQGNMVIKH